MIKKIPVKRKGERWEVVFEEENWICGLYRPEFREKGEIKKLEKHDAPEMFLLLREDVRLVCKDDKGIQVIKLKPDEIVVLDCWHNAYSKNGKGLALVIERKGVKTEFTEI